MQISLASGSRLDANQHLALGPEYYEYEPADLSEEETFKMLKETETDPEVLVNIDKRKRYSAYLELHKDDDDS